MTDTVPALRSAAAEWADQGCIATADLMREAADTIEYLRKLIVELEERVAEDDAAAGENIGRNALMAVGKVKTR